MQFKSSFRDYLMAMSTWLVLIVANGSLAADRAPLPLDEVTSETDSDENGLEETLRYNFSPDDRARLRKALSDYAKNTDPEHRQIEHKRKLMRESVEARFNDCNKDNDDSLDRQEVTHCLPQIARHFSYVDVDEDEVITLEELELAQAKQAERKRAEEAKLEADKIIEAETEIKNKSKAKVNKQAANVRKRPHLVLIVLLVFISLFSSLDA